VSIFAPDLLQHAETLLQQLRARGLTVTTAESCTGGLLSALLTEIPGSSDVFTHGYITYANVAKVSMINVPEALIKTHGAVSEAVARAMAEGALQVSCARISISITGIAGPHSDACVPTSSVMQRLGRQIVQTVPIAPRRQLRSIASRSAASIVG
jgi:nicotinamide-nucleotide amidase